MKRSITVGALATVAAFAFMAPNASAQDTPTTLDCQRSILLFSGSCTVIYECPDASAGCVANGEVNVVADKVTGIVKGEVFTVINPTPAGNDGAVSAACGAPDFTARRCSTQTEFLESAPGATIHVACHANRHFPTLGILVTDLFCRGNFLALEP